METILKDLYSVLLQRKGADPDSSYAAELFSRGEDYLLKKVNEESLELLLAVKTQDQSAICEEGADLLFHVLVLLANLEIPPDRVLQVLVERFGKSGKRVHQKRTAERRTHQQNLFLQFHNGLQLTAATLDVSLSGLLVESDYQPKWPLLGERGVFEVEVQQSRFATGAVNMEMDLPAVRSVLPRENHVESYRFQFVVARVTDSSLGLHIVEDYGLFGFVLSQAAFGNFS
ncbi:MAG: phosphoribosyl-ATP diphosphatase [Magnetococcales bacterium]|nr:phosphoribosyl-ATP diphosphatase [Magnetococcales bacterium]